MDTIKQIDEFLLQNKIQLSARSFVEIVSNIYHEIESKHYDDTQDSVKLAIPYWQKTLQNLEIQFKDKKDLRVLDFGCGTGFATEQILNSNFKNKISQIVCYDLSPDMIQVCKEKFKTIPIINYLIDREGFENLKNQYGKFDIIICNSLIHHILDHEQLFTVFNDSLVSDGLLIIGHEPNKNFYFNKNLQKISSIYRVHKKIINKSKYFLGIKKEVKKGNDKTTLTYNKLLSDGIISDNFPINRITKFVDIHVPMTNFKEQPWGEMGFDKKFFENVSENKFQVIDNITYNHIKDQQAYKNIIWKSISVILKKKYPKDGADAIFVLKKATI